MGRVLGFRDRFLHFILPRFFLVLYGVIVVAIVIVLCYCHFHLSLPFVILIVIVPVVIVAFCLSSDVMDLILGCA